jgi:16S rRNA (cytidine1402-2'-O)-methyltransferase
MSRIGTLWMIPVPIAENTMHTIPTEVLEQCNQLQHFFVENIREARRFLKAVNKEFDIDACSFCEMNRNTPLDIAQLKSWLKNGIDVGVISDAGCPGIADPGALLAQTAQELTARVKALTGPSSIVLSLMASGLNGQSFSFIGYLPVKEPDRSKRIKVLETHSAKEQQTQIFIETPYRNNVLLQDLLKTCGKSTRLCIAIDINGPEESIQTKSIAEWSKQLVNLAKKPAIFLILAP